MFNFELTTPVKEVIYQSTQGYNFDIISVQIGSGKLENPDDAYNITTLGNTDITREYIYEKEVNTDGLPASQIALGYANYIDVVVPISADDFENMSIPSTGYKMTEIGVFGKAEGDEGNDRTLLIAYGYLEDGFLTVSEDIAKQILWTKIRIRLGFDDPRDATFFSVTVPSEIEWPIINEWQDIPETKIYVPVSAVYINGSDMYGAYKNLKNSGPGGSAYDAVADYEMYSLDNLYATLNANTNLRVPMSLKPTETWSVSVLLDITESTSDNYHGEFVLFDYKGYLRFTTQYTEANGMMCNIFFARYSDAYAESAFPEYSYKYPSLMTASKGKKGFYQFGITTDVSKESLRITITNDGTNFKIYVFGKLYLTVSSTEYYQLAAEYAESVADTAPYATDVKENVMRICNGFVKYDEGFVRVRQIRKWNCCLSLSEINEL